MFNRNSSVINSSLEIYSLNPFYFSSIGMDLYFRDLYASKHNFLLSVANSQTLSRTLVFDYTKNVLLHWGI
jgi:hypothetical protein